MILNYINEPFEHLVIPEFLSLEDSTALFNSMSKTIDYDISSYNNRTMFEDCGDLQTSIGIFGADFPYEIQEKINNNLKQVSDFYGYDLHQWEWIGGCNVTNPDLYLGPHTDNYGYVKQSNPNAGILKMLLYLGDGKQDYTDWGTRLYNGENRKESFVSEVPFVPGTALVFKATKESYHGTNFHNGINSYRIIYGAELTDT